MNIHNLSGQTLGQYQIREELGAGGMGAVYRAYQPNLDREVALKVLASELAADSDYVQRFNREARMSAALEHAHIVPIYDFGTERGFSYVIMRLLSGGSLQDRLEQYRDSGQSLPSLPEISRLLNQLGGALDYAHSKGVIHRDIKPSNVMFDNQGSAFLVDFGIAKLVSSNSDLTHTGAMLGTPYFMAPEQWRGETLTPAVDQYALAVVMYVLLTGIMPFQAETPYALMSLHLYEMPTPITDLRDGMPPNIDAVLQRAMSKEARDRYDSVMDFAEAFEKASSALPGNQTGFFTYRTIGSVQPTPIEPLPTPHPVLSRPLPSPPSEDGTPLISTPLPAALTPAPAVSISPPTAPAGGNRLLWIAIAGIILVLGGIIVALFVSRPQEQPTLESELTRVALHITQTSLAGRAIETTNTGEPPTPTVPTETAVNVTDTPAVIAQAETATDQPPPTVTPLPTDTPTSLPPTETPQPTEPPTDTALPPTLVPTDQATAIILPTEQPTEVPATATPEPTVTPTPVPPTATETPSATPTFTPLPTETSTPVPPTSTRLPTQTPLPTETATETPTPSFTPTSTATATLLPPTSTRLPSQTPLPTETPTLSETPTLTLSPTPSAAPTATSTFTPSPTIAATPTVCEASDLNQNGSVDILDIRVVASLYGLNNESPDFNAALDFDLDGTISILDLRRVTSLYGQTCAETTG